MSSGDHFHLPASAMMRASVRRAGFSPPAAELDRFPRHRISLYGSWLWWRLDPIQRRDLGRRELVGLLTAGMCAQSVLSLLGMREAGGRGPVLALAASHRNSALFVRLTAATGVVPYRPPWPVRLAARASAWLPPGPMDPGLVELSEQASLRLAGALADDPGRQPLVREAARLRLVTWVRHLEGSREMLIRAVAARSPVRDPLRAWAVAAATTAAHAVATHPEAYRAAGMVPMPTGPPAPRAGRRDSR